MAKTPLFSTYRQGENRVSASLVAVFERISLDTLERLLASASGEASLSLISFRNQLAGNRAGVPDASISARFHYLFELKTSRGQLDAAQLRRHLDRLGHPDEDGRLFVISPDPSDPAAVGEIADERLVWFNFTTLADAIDETLTDSTLLLAEQERFLLRELQALFAEDGLLGWEDTVAVAARLAYPDYQRHHAYICQPGRHFRPEITRIAFYHRGAIEPEVPLILHHCLAVSFDPETVARLRADTDPVGERVARLIEDTIKHERRVEGQAYQVFLLSDPSDSRTLMLPHRVVNTTERNGRPVAWLQGQRYLTSSSLLAAETTNDL